MKEKKRFWLILLLLLETAFILYRVIPAYRHSGEYHFTMDDYKVYVGGEEKQQGAYVDDSVDGISRKVVSPDFTMQRGVYAVHVTYQTNNQPGTGQIGCYTEVLSNTYTPLFHAGRARMIEALGSDSYRVTTDRQIQAHLEAVLEDHFDAYLLLQNVSIVYLNGTSAARLFLRLFAVFFGIDLVLFLYLFDREKVGAFLKEHAFVVVVFSAVLFIAQMPLMTGGIPEGLDTDFHAVRIWGIAQSLRDGYFPAKVQSGLQNGYGYATGIFYGDVFLYFPALLYLGGLTIAEVYSIFVFGMNLLTLFIAYYSFNRIGKNRREAAAAAAIFEVSLYRLVTLYTRGAVGEWSAVAFYPLILLGVYEIYTEEEQKKKGWLFLAIGMSGVMASHILATVMSVCVLLVFFLLAIRKTLTKRVLLSILKSVLATALLSAYFIVPFLDAFRDGYVHLVSQYGNESLHEVFLNQLFATNFHTTGDEIMNDAISPMHLELPLTFGPAVGVLFLLAIYLLLRLRGEDRGKKKRRLLFIAFGLTALSIFFYSSIFPYARIEEHLPPVAAFFDLFQFAWRLMSWTAALLGLLFLFVLQVVREWKGWKWVQGTILLFLFLFCYQAVNYNSDYSNHAETGKEIVDISRTGAMKLGYAEYAIVGVNPLESDLKTSAPQVQIGSLFQKGLSATAEVDVPKEEKGAFVEFPRYAYRGYHAWDARGKELAVDRSTGKVRVLLPAGFTGPVHIDFVQPWYWRAAQLLSLLFWGMLVYEGIRITFCRYGKRSCFHTR